MSRAIFSTIIVLTMLMGGCVSSPKPALEPKITGIHYYSDPPPNTDRNVYFLSEITNAAGRYFEATVLIESHTKGTTINETRNLLNGTVPKDPYPFRCDLGNFTTLPDDLIIVRSTVEVWTDKGGRSLTRKAAEVNYSSPIKTTDGAYLMIDSVKGVNIGSLWFTLYSVFVTLRNDGYVTAEQANISIQFDDNTPNRWNNESIPPGETRTGSATVDYNQFRITACYKGVPQDSGFYFATG